ncbi:hypothetical protein P3102_04225 [Amycolatopsis sp. QT-25]|uniref:hypothetical protein n=1 Tax=Amycolatopsis sp. QT-25 TaxID=3034022 RepID=UPI0023EDD660|nr:hypothetical protein [Amycolatopsis sp. QT-25]WET80466.1 hypothetical protein P3102_04225 [Amycolatopsis sp. QT-25]
MRRAYPDGSPEQERHRPERGQEEGERQERAGRQWVNPVLAGFEVHPARDDQVEGG